MQVKNPKNFYLSKYIYLFWAVYPEEHFSVLFYKTDKYYERVHVCYDSGFRRTPRLIDSQVRCICEMRNVLSQNQHIVYKFKTTEELESFVLKKQLVDKLCR
jgi:hypothetical protein